MREGDVINIPVGVKHWHGAGKDKWFSHLAVEVPAENGKTVIPFATSASSGLGQSGALLKEMAGSGNWQTGQRFSSYASQSTVVSWINGLGLTA